MPVINKITGTILLMVLLVSVATIVHAQCNYTVTFNVEPTSGPAYITIYLSGLPPNQTVYLHWGIEPYPQGPWSDITDTLMSWDGHNYTVTIGPFQPGTWVAWVFHDATTNTWINYQCQPFWNWNVNVNPPNQGLTWAYVYPNGSILITMLGRAPDNVILWYGLTSGPGNVPWYTVNGTPGAMQAQMSFNPLWGNYSVLIGPFKPGQWIQWVYYDESTNTWLHCSSNLVMGSVVCTPNGNFAIQDVYSPLVFINATYSRYVYTEGQVATVYVTFENEFPSPITVNLILNINGHTYSYNGVSVPTGYSVVALNFTVDLPQGIYTPTLYAYSNGELLTEASLPNLYVLNTTGKPPISLVIVWNMHQPLYIEPNGTWEQAWALLHTCHDFLWNGTWVGAYELQAMLINEYNVSVTIDFTPVLLYQWETILSEGRFPYEPVWPSPSQLNVNLTQCIEAINYTLNLYREEAQEGKLEILTVPFYHPLQAIIYDNGWQSDLIAQLLMGEEMTYRVFGVNATGAWTPEMAFNMGLVHLYNETGIEFTILDAQAFLPYVTVVNGTPSEYGPIIVKDSLGEQIIVLFRDTDLSNAFSFQYFSQPPQVTARELIHYLARIYMQHPGAVVVVALDGENPLIFNPMTGPYDLNAIYQALSEYQGQWLITQTAEEAIKTHSPVAVVTNLPESSWNLNLNNWNNGYPGKIEIWDSVANAREYLVAFTKAVGMPISPVIPLPFNTTPNSTNPIYTLWNYLYIAEGSDWTWQTGPPNYGPAWFKEQALTYTNAIINTIKDWLSQVRLIRYEVEDCELVVQIYNGLNYTLHVNLVASNSTYSVSIPITLRPRHITTVPIMGITNVTTITLYSPVTDNELGAHLIPISSYGFPLRTFTIHTTSNTQCTVKGNGNNDTNPVAALTAFIAGALIIITALVIMRRH
nr:glycoside hydrolase family 57 protein [Vulcanisaeta thermophila]